VVVIKDLITLKELQKIDLEIDELQRNKRLFPEYIETLSEQCRQEHGKVKDKQKLLDGLEQQKRALEFELKEKEEKKRQAENRLMLVKSNEQYKAMQKEVETVKQEITLIEEQVLERMLQIDEVKLRLQEFEKDVMEKTRTIEIRVKEVQQDFSKIDHILADKQKIKQAKAAELKEDVLSDYLRVRSKMNVAVVETHHGKCAGCEIALPTQFYNEIQKGQNIYNCPSCYRILIIPLKD